jgi:hypothetical protein
MVWQDFIGGDENMGSTLEQRLKGLLRILIYPIQFSVNPVSDVDRVVDQVVRSKAMHTEPDEYLNAIEVALGSDERISELIEQKHSESVIRTYLSEIQRRLQRSSPET